MGRSRLLRRGRSLGLLSCKIAQLPFPRFRTLSEGGKLSNAFSDRERIFFDLQFVGPVLTVARNRAAQEETDYRRQNRSQNANGYYRVRWLGTEYHVEGENRNRRKQEQKETAQSCAARPINGLTQLLDGTLIAGLALLQ